MRFLNLFLFLSFWLLCANGNAQTTMTEQVYNPEVKGIENNPMKGWMPGYTGIKSTFPYSIDHFYIQLNKVYTGWGQCNWTEFEKELKRMTDGGRHVVCRFWVHYPTKPSALPDFLKPLVPSYSDDSPDYNDEDFMKAMEDFIALFGAKYDGDPRIVFIEAGLNGKWGEWHTYPENDRAMNQTNKNRLATAYLKAFTKTHIGIRQSNHIASAQKRSFGYYDDSWAHSTLCTGSWCFWNGNIVKDGITDIYKYHPIAGEMRPEVQGEIFNAWPNASKTASGEPMEDMETCIKTTHLSFMKAFGGLFNKVPTATQWANGLKSHKMLGYQFFVKSVQLTPLKSDSFKLDLNIQNRGVAPIYYNWQVEFSAINSSGQWLGIIGTADWNTNTLYPDATNYLKTFSGKLPSKGIYKILMRFKNPLDSYSSSARVLRFANEKQDADKAGWLTLGTIDLISKVNTLEDTGFRNDIRTFPNPASTMLNIESNKNTIKEVSLFSVSGMQLYYEKADASTVQIDIKDLKIKGMILVKVNTDQNISMHKAFITQ